MKIIKPYLLNLFFTIPVIIFTLYSCASKPNIPYPGRMSENFAKLEQWNPLLASEIRKLPEFQDGISDGENKALGKLVALYNENQEAFDKAFEQMYQVGIPEVRKYCSPLQALFWLAEDGKSKDVLSIIKDYSTNTLLNKAWGKKFSLTDKEIDKIIDNIKNKGLKERYIKDKEYYKTKDNHNKMMNLSIKRDYAKGSSVFSNKAMKIINKQFKDTNLRWDKFYKVADRLNSPELIHHFIDNNFKYQRGDFPPAYSTFIRKYGNCTALADFGKYMLERAGYPTFVRSVKWGSNPKRDWHTVSGIIDNGAYLIVVDFGPGGTSISGPYKNTEELDINASHNRNIIDRMWGHPPGPWF